MKPSNLSLGTAAFGMAYGITGSGQKVAQAEVEQIIDEARGRGITRIDTAVAYGTAETVLGEVGVGDFNVQTKVPLQSREQTVSVIEASLKRLCIGRFDSVLLHDVDFSKEATMQQTVEGLGDLVAQGKVASWGYSIYKPEVLTPLLDIALPDVIQGPYSIFDRRFGETSVVELFNRYGVLFQVRSIFLQGLLLMSSDSLPIAFRAHRGLWERFEAWLEREKISKLKACLSFASGLEANSYVIGVQDFAQFGQILSELPTDALRVPESLQLTDDQARDPRNWRGL